MPSKGGLKATHRFSLKICGSKDLPSSKGSDWRWGESAGIVSEPIPNTDAAEQEFRAEVPQSSTGDSDIATSI